jgi:hypothetical protein
MPNQGLEPTPSSVRYAPAFGRGSGPALGIESVAWRLEARSASRSLRRT